MKINNYRGDLSNISARKEALVVGWTVIRWGVCRYCAGYKDHGDQITSGVILRVMGRNIYMVGRSASLIVFIFHTASWKQRVELCSKLNQMLC